MYSSKLNCIQLSAVKKLKTSSVHTCVTKNIEYNVKYPIPN
jgi:hypothetical protein